MPKLFLTMLPLVFLVFSANESTSRSTLGDPMRVHVAGLAPSWPLLEPDTLVQYVCFATDFPPKVFEAVWWPFANSFLGLGLRRIVLASAQVPRSKTLKYQFISRNLWPSAAYAVAVRSNLVGDGGGGPVIADQGGVFRVFAGELLGLERQQSDSKLMFLLRAKTGTATNAATNAEILANAVLQHSTNALKNLAQQQPDLVLAVPTVVLLRAWPAQQQRFDVVAEFYLPNGHGAVMAEVIVKELQQLGEIDWPKSQTARYQEVLTLP
jgi:hypothetical protein